ncbi:hypothetical protein B6N60_04786 [Richelia sinica FACHB-800]|uniref:Uncharacterized protein n=1 Tax=Richelia sinica FACHB-800 TaxID=1357546 RepID=A0A975TC28_9NOST|nr:hypothetical protein B6N60_04786 [Richelia sinica FACHB-800]
MVTGKTTAAINASNTVFPLPFPALLTLFPHCAHLMG